MANPLPDPVPLHHVRRALVTKLRHHGDVLLASPVFTALARAAPDAEVDGLVYADTAPMLTGHPAIAQVHTIDRAWKAHGALAQARGADLSIDRYYFLGSGMRFGLANEISLKMKEMSISHSEPFHVMEFRHGPQTMVGSSTLVVGMIGAANAAQEQAVLSDMRALGGHTLSIGEAGCDMTLASGLSDAARAPLYVVVGQLLALEHAVAKGLNPDRPHNLHAVVKLV